MRDNTLEGPTKYNDPDKLVEHVYENPDTEAKPLQPGDEGYIDPDAFEKKLVEEELARLNKQPDPEEIACMMIKLYTPRVNQLVDQLSNRELKRLIKGLIAFPLGKDYHGVSKLEKEAFMVANSIMDAKMVLVTKTYQDHHEEIIQLAAEANKNATLEYGSVEPVGNNEETEVNKNG